jgi:hypothetical protein
MEVKIYREIENQGLILEESDLEAYNTLALELGLTTVEKQEDKKVPSVYICLNQAMQRQLTAVCPQHIDVEKYRRSTIPLQVLQAYKFCKDNSMYEGFQIWYDDVAPDPMLIGWNYQNDADRTNKYTWRADRFLIARWGDCSMEIPELLHIGFEKMKQQLIDKAKKTLSQINDVLLNPDVYTRDIIQGRSVSIDLNVDGGNTIY